MDLQTFLRLAKKYNDLGWSVQGQLRAVSNGENMGDQNPYALSICADFLDCLSNEEVTGAYDLAEEISEFLADREDDQ